MTFQVLVRCLGTYGSEQEEMKSQRYLYGRPCPQITYMLTGDIRILLITVREECTTCICLSDKCVSLSLCPSI